MKTHIKITAALALVVLASACSKDYRYADSTTNDQAANADVLTASTWRAEKQTDKTFMNSIMLTENSVNYDSSGTTNTDAFDLVFAHGIMYKVMRNNGDTVESKKYMLDDNSIVYFNYDSQNGEIQGPETGRRTIMINGAVMTHIDLGQNGNGQDVDADTNPNNNANDGALKRIERITILRRVR